MTSKLGQTTLCAAWFWPTLGRFPGTWGIFSSTGDSELTRDGLGFQWNGERENIWTLGFELLGQNIAPLHLKTQKVGKTALRAGWFSTTLGRFAGTRGIFCSPADSKIARDGPGFLWNGQRKNIWTLGFELLGRNIAPLHFKTEKVAESALRVAWFWPTLCRVPGTWGIFSSLKDSKLTRDSLGFRWNRQRKSIWTLGLELLGRNIAPPHFKTQKLAQSALRVAWFWPTLGRFPVTWRIFSSPRDSKLTRDGLGFQENWQRKKIYTFGFKLLGENIAPLPFKTEKVSETTLHAAWFWSTLGRYPGTWGTVSSPGDSKPTRNCLGFQWNGERKIIQRPVSSF